MIQRDLFSIVPRSVLGVTSQYSSVCVNGANSVLRPQFINRPNQSRPPPSLLPTSQLWIVLSIHFAPSFSTAVVSAEALAQEEARRAEADGFVGNSQFAQISVHSRSPVAADFFLTF